VLSALFPHTPICRRVRQGLSTHFGGECCQHSPYKRDLPPPIAVPETCKTECALLHEWAVHYVAMKLRRFAQSAFQPWAPACIHPLRTSEMVQSPALKGTNRPYASLIRSQRASLAVWRPQEQLQLELSKKGARNKCELTVMWWVCIADWDTHTNGCVLQTAIHTASALHVWGRHALLLDYIRAFWEAS
jgi:hypothetical protein